MAEHSNDPGAGASKDKSRTSTKPLARGFGDEHGGYVVDAESEHTVADPGVVSPDAKGTSDTDKRPARDAANTGSPTGR